jgi:hypothetical protein
MSKQQAIFQFLLHPSSRLFSKSSGLPFFLVVVLKKKIGIHFEQQSFGCETRVF